MVATYKKTTNYIVQSESCLKKNLKRDFKNTNDFANDMLAGRIVYG